MSLTDTRYHEQNAAGMTKPALQLRIAYRGYECSAHGLLDSDSDVLARLERGEIRKPSTEHWSLPIYRAEFARRVRASVLGC